MSKPIIFLAFANDLVEYSKYLRNLDVERKGIREALQTLEKEGYIEIVEKVNATLSEIFDTFQDSRYRDRIVGFHYGGHADGYHLVLNSSEGKQVVGGSGIVALLAEQKSLKFAFFNGCSTKEYADALKNTLPLVISTENSIVDAVAKDLALRFYKALAENIPIQKAFQQALAFITSQYGRDNEKLYRKREETPKYLPWFLSVNPQRNKEATQWTLKPATDSQKEGEAASDQVNQFLVEPLYEALATHSPELLQKNEWKNKDWRRVKLSIIESFPYPISVHLRKLFANTSEITAFSEARMRQLLKTYTEIRVFMLNILLSELWEIQHRNGVLLIDTGVLERLKNFLAQSHDARQGEIWELCQTLLQEIELIGETTFVSDLPNLLPLLQDTNSQWQQACRFLDSQNPMLSAGEARTTILETEAQLSLILRTLAFWVKYKLQVVKNIVTQKVRMQDVRFQHNILFFNHQNAELSEDERQEAIFFTDSRSIILHRSTAHIPQDYLNLTPFLIDANSFRGAVNAQLFYIGQQINADKWLFQSIDNDQSLDIEPTNEFYEVKFLLDKFAEDCLGV